MNGMFRLMLILFAVGIPEIQTQANDIPFVGNWEVTDSKGMRQVWEIYPDGTTLRGPKRQRRGRYSVHGNGYLVTHYLKWEITLSPDGNRFQGICKSKGRDGMTNLGIRISDLPGDLASSEQSKMNSEPIRENKSAPVGDGGRRVDSWTNMAGVVIEAEFIALVDGKLTIRKTDEQVFTIPLETLNPASQTKAMELAKMLGNRLGELRQQNVSSDHYTFSARTAKRGKNVRESQTFSGVNVATTVRDTATDVSMFFTKGPSRDYYVEVLFFAKEEDGKNIFLNSHQRRKVDAYKAEFRFDAPTLIGTIKRSISIPISGTGYARGSGPVQFSTRLNLESTVSGSQIYGWLARVIRDGEVHTFETNNRALREFSTLGY